MILLRILLFPFALLYYVVTEIRNRLYDQGLKPSVKFDLPVISVGNLSVGGTGKTPMIEHLIRLLYDRYKVATLSRGYGRTTRGIRIAGSDDSALTLGDEPFQFQRKFGNNITVAVGEERALAIPVILQERSETQIILLDDAFQHRQVVPRFSILLTDYHRPFHTDFLLPSGRLRESRWSAQRADTIVVTKCPPEISADEMMRIEKSVRVYTEKPVFFTSIRYGQTVPFSHSPNALSQNIVLVTAIANSKPLKDFMGHRYTIIKHFSYRDHHRYNEKDIKTWLEFADKHPDISFLTTEKDKVKLDTPAFHELMEGLSFFYLPIEVDFVKAGKDFDEMVLNVAKGEQ